MKSENCVFVQDNAFWKCRLEGDGPFWWPQCVDTLIYDSVLHLRCKCDIYAWIIQVVAVKQSEFRVAHICFKLETRLKFCKMSNALWIAITHRIIIFYNKIWIFIFIAKISYPDSKVHGANTGPTWALSAPDGPHVGPMNLAIRVHMYIFPWSTYNEDGDTKR